MSALVVLGAVAAIGGVVLLAEWGWPAGGPAAARIRLRCSLAVTAQSNRARIGFAFVGGVLVRG